MNAGTETFALPVTSDPEAWDAWREQVLASGREGPVVIEVSKPLQLSLAAFARWREIAAALADAGVSFRCRPEGRPLGAALRVFAGLSAVPGGKLAPLQVDVSEDGVLHLQPERDMALEPDAASAWIEGIAEPRVRISLARVEQVDSLLIAWMLQVRSVVGEQGLEVVDAAHRVYELLRQMRLEGVLKLQRRR